MDNRSIIEFLKPQCFKVNPKPAKKLADKEEESPKVNVHEAVASSESSEDDSDSVFSWLD